MKLSNCHLWSGYSRVLEPWIENEDGYMTHARNQSLAVSTIILLLYCDQAEYTQAIIILILLLATDSEL